MRRLNLPLVLDTLFAGVAAFLLFFTAVRFYTKSAVLGLAFGVAACLIFGALVCVYISRKQSETLLLSRDERNKKLLALHLSLSSDGYVKNLFKKCLGEEARIRGSKVLLGNAAHFFDFKMQPLSEDDIARVIKHKFDGEKQLFCTKISPEALALATNFAIKIVGINDVYSMLKDKDLLPEKYVYEGAKKSGFLKRVKSRFSRKLCAPLFWSGAALLALSYFTFFPIYYIVSGGIMLILSAVALLVNR